MEYSSKVRGKEESVYDKVAREFRELEKNADKYFDNLDAVEEMCTKQKKKGNKKPTSSPPFCKLCRASKKKGARFMFLYSISKNPGP